MSLVLVMGLPAAGKSSLCEKIREFHSDVVVFSLDDVNGRWSEDFRSHAERKSFEQTIHRYLEAQSGEEFSTIIVVDDNFYLRSMRRPFERMARSFGLYYCCVYVAVEVEEALRRNSRRGEDRVDDQTILRMAREMEVPDDAIVCKGGTVEEIFSRLSGPRPNCRRIAESQLRPRSVSILSEADGLLRRAVAEAVREGLDGRLLATAKKVLMNRCRQSRCILSEGDVRESLRDEYHRLESSGG